jgi:hypothetical protein
MRTLTGWPSTRAWFGDTDNVVKSKAAALGAACADGIPAATVTPAIARARRARFRRPGPRRRRRNQEFACDHSRVPSSTTEA